VSIRFFPGVTDYVGLKANIGRSEGVMRKNLVVVLYVALSVLGAVCFAESVGVANQKILYVYDEVNENSRPYIGYFRDAFDQEGIAYDEIAAGEIQSAKLAEYRVILVHGMVMAFNAKSPVRDWLKSSPDLSGKKVSLFVTANRWFLKDLYRDLTALLKKENANVIDAVSAATKDLDGPAKSAAVRKQVKGLTLNQY
jgi:hypothetical protein